MRLISVLRQFVQKRAEIHGLTTSILFETLIHSRVLRRFQTRNGWKFNLPSTNQFNNDADSIH